MASKKPTAAPAEDGNDAVKNQAAEAAPTKSEATKLVADPAVPRSGESTPPKVPGTSRNTKGAPDPFDPESLRLSQEFSAGLGVSKQLLTVPVRKPSKEKWNRVHADETYRLQTLVLELKDDREIYLIDRKLWPDLASESNVSPRALFTTIDKQGTVFLWPIRLPADGGKLDDWNRSALEAADMAAKQWVRVAANMDAGFYDVFTTKADLPEPTWPEVSFNDLLKTAFKDRMIDSLDHDVLKQLQGKA